MSARGRSNQKNGHKPAAKKPKRLTAKREKFVVEKIKADAEGRSATSAAIAAGYAPSSARQRAYELVTNSDIQARIERAKRHAGVTAEEIIGTLALQMHSDIADLLDEEGHFDYKLAKGRGVTGQIKKMKVKKNKLQGDEESGVIETTYDLEMYSAQEAASKLANIYGLNQAPRENESDLQRKRDWAETQLQRVIMETGMDREAAIAWMQANTPSAAAWIN